MIEEGGSLASVDGTKTCPECAESVKSAALVCRFCGFRFDSTEEPGDESEADEYATSSFDSAFAGRGMLAWALASCALAVIGAFGPWVSALGSSISGTDGSGDGWIIVVLVVLAGLYVYGNRHRRRAGVGALIFGAISLGLAGYDREHATRIISNAGTLAQALVHVGWGLNLAAAASISLVLCGLVWLRIPGD